jgi:quinol monooxygenase YgiN
MVEIVVVGRLIARPGKQDELTEVLSALAARTHAEDGCLLYALHREVDDPDQYAIIERWASPEALRAHLRSDHFAAVIARAEELLAGPPNSVTYRSLPVGDPVKGLVGGPAA